MAEKEVILGAGGHAKVVIDLLKSLKTDCDIELLDDAVPKGTFISGIPVCGKISECTDYSTSNRFIIGIGNNHTRKIISEKYNLHYITLIHPSAVIGSGVKLGEGTVVMANAVINSDSFIGKHCIINTAASVDHECEIADYVHISPGVHLAGNVKIGEESWIGIGACVSNGLGIMKNSVVGAGTVVIRDIPDGCTAVGNPARIIKYN